MLLPAWVLSISAVRKILSANVSSLGSSDILLAEDHLSTAHDVLHGVAASILRVVPIASQNLNAVRDSVDQTLPVLARARGTA